MELDEVLGGVIRRGDERWLRELVITLIELYGYEPIAAAYAVTSRQYLGIPSLAALLSEDARWQSRRVG